MKSLPIAVLIPLLLFAAAPSDALAGKRSLWKGLVTFNQPAKTTVQEIGGAGWDESFSVTPRQSGQKFRGVTFGWCKSTSGPERPQCRAGNWLNT